MTTRLAAGLVAVMIGLTGVNPCARNPHLRRRRPAESSPSERSIGVDPPPHAAILPTEVRETVKLYLDGKIDQWFSLQGRPGVVFILNVTDAAAAHEMLEKLPLGQSASDELRIDAARSPQSAAPVAGNGDGIALGIERTSLRHVAMRGATESTRSAVTINRRCRAIPPREPACPDLRFRRSHFVAHHDFLLRRGNFLEDKSCADAASDNAGDTNRTLSNRQLTAITRLETFGNASWPWREHEQGEEAMSNSTAGTESGRGGRIDMDELPVFRHVGERIDAYLANVEPA